MALSTLPVLCSHHCSLIPEHFHPSNRKPVPTPAFYKMPSNKGSVETFLAPSGKVTRSPSARGQPGAPVGNAICHLCTLPSQRPFKSLLRVPTHPPGSILCTSQPTSRRRSLGAQLGEHPRTWLCRSQSRGPHPGCWVGLSPATLSNLCVTFFICKVWSVTVL